MGGISQAAESRVPVKKKAQQ